MANLFQLDTIKYVCCCGSLNPICFVYFCKHCLRLRCRYCVSPEVDSLFCGNCSENMPAAEAKQKKNKCNACYDCPSCKQTLSIRASTLQVPCEGDSTRLVPKKLHYLVCGFCRWSSREAGIPDKLSAAGPWLEPENTDVSPTPLDSIADYFRQLGVYEKASKDKKHVHISKFLAAGRHGVAHLLPKRVPSTSDETAKVLPQPKYLAPSLGDADLPEVSETFYTEDHVIAKWTTMTQRLTQVEHQPRHVSGLLPLKKHLLIKRSLRCRVCEHIIIKPEYSPVSIKFKMQMSAYYHVPQVRLLNPLSTPLQPGQRTTVIVRISNPTAFPTSVKFLPFEFVPLRKVDGKVGDLESVGTESSTDPPSLTPFSLSPATQLMREVTVLPIYTAPIIFNCQLQPTEGTLILPPNDIEAAEFESSPNRTSGPDFNDDPNFVPWRRSNKANVVLQIERDSSTSVGSEPLTLGFTMEYDFTNYDYVSDTKGSGPQKLRIQTHVIVNLTEPC